MKNKYKIILFFLIVPCVCQAGLDVNDVFVQGDSTLMGMKIESSWFADGAFLVETTGARFEYVKGQLKIYQGLDGSNRRLLSTITFDNEPNFVKAKVNDDHILFWSEKLNIGIYGDSTLIISPKVKQALRCKGNFKPDYEGRYKGELLLIDELGGMEIYPQRYEAGYKIKKSDLGKKNWIAEYLLNAGERVMIAAFPGRPFDWEKSFKSHILITYGSRGLGVGNPYGQMPPDKRVKKWALEGFNIIVMFYEGVYANVPREPYPEPAGPYVVVNKPEFHRFMKAVHANNMKLSLYVSLYYHYCRFKSVESFYKQVKELRTIYGIDGIYLDGMLSEDSAKKIDDKIQNWEMIRRLRQLFGPDGSIIYHGTNRGSVVATVPNIDSYCTATLNGEGVPFKTANEPYVKYQVRKYGISNTIGMWLPNKRPASFTYGDIIDAVLAMNGRHYSYGGVAVWTPPKNNRYVWHNGTHTNWRNYLKRLEILKANYKKQQKTNLQ